MRALHQVAPEDDASQSPHAPTMRVSGNGWKGGTMGAHEVIAWYGEVSGGCAARPVTLTVLEKYR